MSPWCLHQRVSVVNGIKTAVGVWGEAAQEPVVWGMASLKVSPSTRMKRSTVFPSVTVRLRVRGQGNLWRA